MLFEKKKNISKNMDLWCRPMNFQRRRIYGNPLIKENKKSNKIKKY